MKFHRHAFDGPASLLWVLLPGAYMKPEDFLQAGFVDAVRSRGLPHHAVLLEATIPEVADGSALRFLQAFLCDDMQAAGVPAALVGISLGAHLALACLARAECSGAERQAAARVRQACLLAPYVGPRDIVAQAGEGEGLKGWQAPPGEPDDIDRRIWRWLQSPRPDGCELHLGCGGQDRFAEAHALMARYLPADRFDVQPGGHDWATWTVLWNRYLDRHAVT